MSIPSLSDSLDTTSIPAFKPEAPASTPAPVTLRDPFDFDARREDLLSGVKSAFENHKPMQNDQVAITFHDVAYEGPKPTLKDQKAAMENGSSVGHQLKGTVRLTDVKSGQVLDEKRTLLARVPHMTDQGTFIFKGSAYSLSNQQRLKAGAYTRRKANGQLEAHFNVAPGTGKSFRMSMEPESGLFSLESGHAKIPFVPVMRALGVPDEAMSAVLGPQLWEKNAQKGKHYDLARAVEKLSSERHMDAAGNDPAVALRSALADMRVDPEVMRRNLGVDTDQVNHSALLAAVGKILAVNHGHAQEDDRDHLANMQVWTPERMFKERVERDAGGIRRATLWRATGKRNLSGLQAGAFSPYMSSTIIGSGMGAPLAGINPLETASSVLKITRMGQGGISSADAVPDESRSVHPSQFGFIDSVSTPESLSAGIDLRLTHNTRIGSDGHLYQQFKNLHTGKEEWVNPVQLAGKGIAFPNELSKPEAKEFGVARGFKNGREAFVHTENLDYELPDAKRMSTLTVNLIHGLSGDKGGRLSMGSRFWTQAVPLDSPEAPLLDQPGSEADELQLSKLLGAKHAPADGQVTRVEPGMITVKGHDGKTHEVEVPVDIGSNQKSYQTGTPVVQLGQMVAKNQLLAKSNYTDDQGRVALGRNIRMAYLPMSGTFEDGIVLSESAAKKFTSQGMTQPYLDTKDSEIEVGKHKFLSIWPGKFTAKQMAMVNDDGLVHVGQTVEEGDPLVLASDKRPPKAGQALINGRTKWHADASVTWDKPYKGVVTAVSSKNGYHQVSVKHSKPTEVGDKLAGLHGQKGVISRVLPDAQMPHTADGQPLEMVLNSMGTISRVNGSNVTSAVLGKLAEKTGVRQATTAFQPQGGDAALDAQTRMTAAGLTPEETVTDPTTGRTLKNVFVGNMYTLKLHHHVDSKIDARSTGGYTQNGEPAKTSSGSAKRVGGLEISAMLAHNATENIKDIKLIKGQKNDKFWTDFKLGHPVQMPTSSVMYDRFLNHLRGAGVNVNQRPEGLQFSPMTDKDVLELTKGRQLTSGDALEAHGRTAVKGGLFDTGLTGGHEGLNWTQLALHEPVPHPMMVDPLRRILGLTNKQLEAEMAAQEGGAKLKARLSALNLESEHQDALQQVKTGPAATRDDQIKRLRAIESFRRQKLDPADMMITQVPVLPPKFRPVTHQRGMELTSDANLLYKDLWEANQNLKKMSTMTSDTGPERLAVYHALKAVTGLGDPLSKDRQDKQVGGLLQHVFGKQASKLGMYQRQVLSTAIDMVGRSTIIPDDRLDMDELAIPEDMAWDLYKPFILRRLNRRFGGADSQTPMQAKQLLELIEKRDPRAKTEMLNEMAARPIIYSRAPAWHKFSTMAARPVLTSGKALRIPPLVTSGLGADFDGDQIADVVILQHPVTMCVTGAPMSHSMLAQLPVLAKGHTCTLIDLQDFPHGDLRAAKDGKNGPISFYDAKPALQVVVYDKDSAQLKWAPVDGWSEHADRLIEIVNLSSGYQIITDDDDRAVYGIAPQTFQEARMRPAAAVGSILVPRAKHLPVPDEAIQSIPTAQFIPEHRADWRVSPNTTKELPERIQLDYGFGYLLGAFIGDGWASGRKRADGSTAKSQVAVCGLDSDIQTAFTTQMRRLVPGISTTLYVRTEEMAAAAGGHGAVSRNMYGSKRVADMLDTLCGHGAREKHLPPFYLTAPLEFKRGLFGGLMDTDGSVAVSNAKKKPQLMATYNSISLRLCREVRLLAASLGIRGRISSYKYKKQNSDIRTEQTWLVTFSTIDVVAWGGSGMQCARKLAKFKGISCASDSGMSVRMDLVPFPLPLRAQIKALIPTPKRNLDPLYTAFASQAVKRGSTTRNWAERFLAEKNWQTTDLAADPIFTKWRQIVANVAVTWDEVESFETTNIRETGYDLTVPGYETFMNVDGVILSNTMNAHIPISDKAVAEAYEKMLPSKNLYSETDFSPQLKPSQEYLLGLWQASQAPKEGEKPRMFNTSADALRAYNTGEISVNTKIKVLNPG